MAVVTQEFEPALTPDDIGWLAGLSSLPVVVKGVQRADDAVRCVDAGRRGGGGVEPRGPPAGRRAGRRPTSWPRSSTPSTGGPRSTWTAALRRAPDVVKALALGARAVLVGRPSLWALATGGADGVAGAAGLVRDGAATGDGLVRRGDGRRHRPRPGAAGRPGGRARHDDGRRDAGRPGGGRPHRRRGRRRRQLDVAPGRGRGCGPRCAGPLADGRRGCRTSGCCCPTGPSTCSGSTARRWPGRPSWASTRPGAARRWRRTCEPPTAP